MHYHRYHYYPSCQLVSRAAMKLFHPSLSQASLWTVPQLWFVLVISASSSLPGFLQLTRLLLSLCVQWIAIWWCILASLCSTCPIQCHCFLVMMVSISSCWHHAKRSQLEVVLGQKMHLIFLRLVVWKDDNLARSCSVICQNSDPYTRVNNTQLW